MEDMVPLVDGRERTQSEPTERDRQPEGASYSKSAFFFVDLSAAFAEPIVALCDLFALSVQFASLSNESGCRVGDCYRAPPKTTHLGTNSLNYDAAIYRAEAAFGMSHRSEWRPCKFGATHRPRAWLDGQSLVVKSLF
jgi:hypothetical protein